jgi:hypothetical protein
MPRKTSRCRVDLLKALLDDASAGTRLENPRRRDKRNSYNEKPTSVKK